MSGLPPGRLSGHYTHKQQLYTVHMGFPDMVLNTPPLRKHQSLIRLPIIKDEDSGFRLHPDVADTWLDLEICLRAVGREMFRLAPVRYLSTVVNSWFFPRRFLFMNVFRNENAARFAAWRSIENFLPLIPYVSMGIWCMQSWESQCAHRNEDKPNWRALVTENTKVHPTWLDYLEKSIIANWYEEHVGALYQIRSPADMSAEERERRGAIEMILNSIWTSNCPIPIYLSWGTLPPQISTFDVPVAFQRLIPDEKELELFASDGEMKFSRWAIAESGRWFPDPYMPTPPPIAPAPQVEFSAPTPFPPLPANSAQRQGETIQAFFTRRKDANRRKIEKENSTERHRRMQRAEHAMRGVVPSKAGVFFWEKQDGHYIRQHANRAEFEDLWFDYPGPQRRFDPIHNEWDLCQLFEENDPVFGEGYANTNADSDDEVDFDHPTFPQNVDMATFLPRDSTSTEVVQTEQQPHDLEMPADEVVQTERRPHDIDMPPEDVPQDEDLGQDFAEFDLPKRDVAKSSRNCVDFVFLRFGITARTQKPQYELITQNFLDALRRRFGFVTPPSPHRFVARDPPQQSLKSFDIPNVIGMSDTADHLVSQTVMGTFFGQCLGARSVNTIDKALLDYHVHSNLSPRWAGPPSPFHIGREYLKSMRHPSEARLYYLLHRPCSGLGSQVLLLPRATDFVEVLRQGWGPDIKDVVGHLVARGIAFWLAYMSADVMPSSNPPKNPIVDIASGLGFRPHGYKFDKHDYHAYTIQHEIRLLHTRRGRIAFQYGSVMARLAREEVSDEDFLQQFDDEIYDVSDCLWDEKSPHAYWHDALTDHEIELLYGVYHVGTGQQKVIRKDTHDRAAT
ncbi:hypothetical protein K438DRAFT_2005113 [Mycena galopus ATCC 62051]|nr:hypothetical protein K438DRAFT_2005113 [Mycena galopus ATCC 62051]